MLAKKKYNRGAGKYPDKRSIIAEIWRRYNDDLPLNYNAIHAEDDALRRRSTYLFGGWRYAVETAGFIYDKVRVDTDKASYFGHKFERLFGEILFELDISFEQYAHSKYCPDYVIDHGRWIDVKLSEWTITNRDCDTVGKYEPHCRSLTIVYLRGRILDKMITDKTRLIHIDYYLKQLPRRRRGYFYAQINGLLTDLDENNT